MSSGGKGRGIGSRWPRPGNVRPSPAPGDADNANADALRDFFFGTAAPPTINGTGAITLASDTVAGVGNTTVVAAGAITLTGDTVAGTGTSGTVSTVRVGRSMGRARRGYGRPGPKMGR
jgi:hypothetical protein